ncbi:hemagglutinin repeat-containing protein [Variovorax sp. N23]|uniref:hemagglutinin repeat-containing protein n=1 Tax=Variovorax sp. N23 TaxID=2980555 RepID=UPI0021C696F9|nr:hemagglutinin repeat-containing protein [Variovorax sp. N23]MCU4117472.1 hemagglutinin repeat-containing protein [Variovorax sp. N23]
MKALTRNVLGSRLRRCSSHRVNADIGGKLHIESLQDRAKSDSKQQSAGGSLSVGAGV